MVCGVAFVMFVQFGLKCNWTHKHGRTATLRHRLHVCLLKKDSRADRFCAPLWRQWLWESLCLFGSAPTACLLILVVIKCVFNNHSDNNNSRSAVAANTSSLQHTSFLSEPNKIPPFPLPHTVTPTIAGRTSSSLLQCPVPVHSRSQFSYCTNAGYTSASTLQVSVQLLYRCWPHGQKVTAAISVRTDKLKDEILSQDCPRD